MALFCLLFIKNAAILQNRVNKRCICLHEIGHLWSLRHVTTGNSVMDIPWLSSQSYSITIPQQDDLNGVDAVY